MKSMLGRMNPKSWFRCEVLARCIISMDNYLGKLKQTFSAELCEGAICGRYQTSSVGSIL